MEGLAGYGSSDSDGDGPCDEAPAFATATATTGAPMEVKMVTVVTPGVAGAIPRRIAGAFRGPAARATARSNGPVVNPFALMTSS
jgi:hypothetical protein